MAVIRYQHPVPERRKPHFVSAVRAGGTVYLSGQLATGDDGRLVGPDDAEAQVRQIFHNVARALEQAGASLGDIVKLVAYLTDAKDYPAYARVKAELFPFDPPAGTAVIVAALLVPGARIEIDITAATTEG